MWAGTAENHAFSLPLPPNRLIFHKFNELGDKNTIRACIRKVHDCSVFVMIQNWLTSLLIKDSTEWNCLMLCWPQRKKKNNPHEKHQQKPKPQIYKIFWSTYFILRSAEMQYLDFCVLKETKNCVLCPWAIQHLKRFLVLVLHIPLSVITDCLMYSSSVGCERDMRASRKV